MSSDRAPDERLGAFVFALTALALVIVPGGTRSAMESDWSAACRACPGAQRPRDRVRGLAAAADHQPRPGRGHDPTKPYMPVWHGIVYPHRSPSWGRIRAGLPAAPRGRPDGGSQRPGARGLRGRRSTSATDVSTAMARTASAACRTRSRRTGRSGALRRRLPERVRHPRQDRGRDPVGQRDRPGADREHAALGRNSGPTRRGCPDRLPGDPPVPRTRFPVERSGSPPIRTCAVSGMVSRGEKFLIPAEHTGVR
jgi:hypothetical protein